MLMFASIWLNATIRSRLIIGNVYQICCSTWHVAPCPPKFSVTFMKLTTRNATFTLTALEIWVFHSAWDVRGNGHCVNMCHINIPFNPCLVVFLWVRTWWSSVMYKPHWIWHFGPHTQECSETKTHTNWHRGMWWVCLGTGSCRLWQDRLIVLQSRYSYFRTVCVSVCQCECMCVSEGESLFFWQTYWFYMSEVYFADLKFVDHTTSIQRFLSLKRGKDSKWDSLYFTLVFGCSHCRQRSKPTQHQNVI